MGQQQTKQLTIARSSPPRVSSRMTSGRKPLSMAVSRPREVECEGLLKLRATPFKNSVEVEVNGELLFLENVELTLKSLLESRLNTNKLFLLEDIEKLIESLTFTLAFLQQKNITYRDIAPENIYYDSGLFKLMPNSLLQLSTYQKLKQDIQAYPSPELLIGLKLNEEDIEDQDILEKCNVFTLGMVMLEVATLLPSWECYDLQNYQILDDILKERILLVSECYGERIARIIANMIDYDYTERMTLKQLSIWVNRELQMQKNSETNNDHGISSVMISKVAEKQPDFRGNPSHNNSVAHSQTRRLSKNNSVYMKKHTQSQMTPHKEERNRIYINDRPHQQAPKNKLYTNTSHNASHNNHFEPRNQYPERHVRPIQKMVLHHQHFHQTDSFKFPDNHKPQLRHPNPYCDEFRFPREEKVSREEKEQSLRSQKDTENQYRPYYPETEGEKQGDSNPRREERVLRELNNQYYPKIEDILQSKRGGGEEEKGSIFRIKEEIARSRRRLQEFRKSEGLKR